MSLYDSSSSLNNSETSSMSDNLTISQVAKAAGLSRVTVYKAVNSGELSVSVNPVNGVKTVSKSELARFLSVRGVKPLQSTNSKHEQVLTVNTHNDLQAQVNSLQALLAAKDQVLEAKEQVIAEQSKRLLLLEDRREARPAQQEQNRPVEAPEITQKRPADRKPRTLFERLAKAAQVVLDN